MFDSEILDVAIGVIFVFLLVSMICSAIREALEGWLKTRATHLEEGIRQLLHDRQAAGLARNFFEHPLIYSLYSGAYPAPQPDGRWPTALKRGRNLPSYIPSRNFALALMDLAARGPSTDEVSSDPATGAVTLDQVRVNLRYIGNPSVQRALLVAIDSAQGDFQKAVANVEAWYDSGMDRVSGWYKRSTQWILFGIAIVVTIALNVNTVAIAEYLYHQKAAREALVAQAQAAVRDPNFPDRGYSEIRTQVAALTLPIGWTRVQRDANGAPMSANPLEALAGWLVTAFAATLGAPFWFDMLNKVMVIRSTVKPHEKSGEESSEDRQTSKDRTAPASTGQTQVPAPAAAPPSPVTQPVPGPAAPMVTAASTVLPPDAVDGCDVDITDFTDDEDLPAAEGGVA